MPEIANRKPKIPDADVFGEIVRVIMVRTLSQLRKHRE